ncbi:WXG100-like domain-containing protein [Streptomyces lydicus]|uniref:WXG100-like domain-containing protein n=1 Tax=Streptomyces lydicus TaxID=47763 RepID=UPI0036E6D42E
MSHSPGQNGKPIELHPDDLHRVALKFAKGQDRLDSVSSTLNTALQNAAGMAGNDDYGHKFGKKYDPAANALFRTLSGAVRAIGQHATGLVTTANNYLKADHHSNAKGGKGGPEQYPAPPVFTDIMYPDAASAIGPGHSDVPDVIAKYWPNGHQDKLRAAAAAYRTAATAINDLGNDLHQQVRSITDNNDDDSVDAMAHFWAQIWQGGHRAGKAPLSAAKHACDELAKACESFAHAIDEAHSETESNLAEAGIAITVTTIVGVLLTPFTGGGSDAGAAALDSAEAAAILGGVEVALDDSIAAIGTDMIADLETYLQAAADGVPEFEAVDAETTEVGQVLERELAETEAREPAGVGGRGGGQGGSGEKPGTGGRGGESEEPAEESGGHGARKRGQDYEDHLEEKLGGEGSFKSGKREFDGKFTDESGQEAWYEAKSGQYWEKVNSDEREMLRFKSKLMESRKIAAENGKDFYVISERPIPENILQWLAKKGVPYKIIPRG